MAEDTQQGPVTEEAVETPVLHVAPSPHLAGGAPHTTRWMMLDVLIALVPVVAMAVYVFHWYAVLQVAICIASCLVAEALFTAWRGRKQSLGDCSAAVTGVILGLSLPWMVETTAM